MTLGPFEKICSNCLFWKRLFGQRSIVLGDCRIKSPTVLCVNEFGESYSRVESHWPETNDDEWCGDWKGDN